VGNSIDKGVSMFPSFVLNKLYVKGSLKNCEKGFQFDLKNVVDSGTLVEIGPVTVDGKPYETSSITIMTSNQERTADQVTRTSPLSIHLGMLFSLRVNGEQLAQGEHTVNVSVLTREIGRIKFDFQDTIA
jgi:hydroxymethylglutaryl-CoA reductase (NADPH)